MENERDYIGNDPIAWVDRLIEVAEGSNFEPFEKNHIVTGLYRIKGHLVRLEESREKAGISK